MFVKGESDMKLSKIVSLILAVIMLLSCLTVVMAANPATIEVTAREDAPSISIDGNFSTAEWGEPIATYTTADCNATDKDVSMTNAKWYNGWHAGARKTGNTQNGTATVDVNNQKVAIYVRRDNTYVYVAARLINASKKDMSVTDINKMHEGASLSFTIGTYNAATTIHTDSNNKEQFVLYTMGLLNQDGTLTKANKAYALVGTPGALAETNYAINYEDATSTYIYEVRIPYSETLGYVSADKDLTMSFDIADANGGNNNGTGNWHYMLSCATHMYVGYNMYGTSSTIDRHKTSKPLHVVFDDRYVSTVAAPMPATAPTLDGSVTTGEWGAPVIVTSEEHAKTQWTNQGCWIKNDSDVDQRVKVYLTNDENFIYLAVTLDREEPTKGWTNETYGHLYPKLGFVLAATNESGTAIAQTADGKDRFNAWDLHFKEDGTPVLEKERSVGNSGMYYELTQDDYDAAYNEQSKTYTYEVRIPYNLTNIVPSANTKMVMSLHVSTSHDGDTSSVENKRYNIGTRWDKLFDGTAPFTTNGNYLIMQLNDVTAVGDAYVNSVASSGQNIMVDGKIDASEWGAPMAVMAPQNNGIIKFWNKDTKNGAQDQRAKIYLSNDSNYIYVGATLNRTERGLVGNGKEWNYPLFQFTLSAWDDTYNVKRVDVEGEQKEQYAKYVLALGEKVVCQARSTQTSNRDLTAEDYAVTYDPDTRTYTYEIRIPIEKTNIDYYQSLDVAFSAQVGDSQYQSEDAENDRYNLGLGAVNNTNKTYPHEGDGRCVKVTLNEPDWATAGTYVKDTVAEKKGDITIDANVSGEEWGDPVVVTGPQHALGYWTPNGYVAGEPDKTVAKQRAKIYMTNDSKYLYVAATLDHSNANVNLNADNSGLPQFAITLSKYNEGTNVVRVNGKEQFTSYRIGVTTGGEIKATTDAYQLNDFALADEDWAVKYDETNQTYIYELRIPLSSTNINVYDASQIAASILIGDSNYGTNGNENNRYNIGGTGAANAHTAGTDGNYPHAGQPALVMTLRAECYVKDTVETTTTPMIIDGKITVAEWGEPIIVTNPKHTQATWKSFWEYEKSAVDHLQTAKIYMRNDSKGIYVGAVLDRSEYNTLTTNINGADLVARMRPHFRFTYSAYDEEYTVQHIRYNKQNWEAYGGYMLSLDNNGEVVIQDLRQGMDAMKLDPSNYTVKYDPVNMTYTYEMYIPYEYTNIDIYKAREMAFSASIGTTYAGIGEQSNRYNITTGQAFCKGAENFAHQGNALKLTLGDARIKIDTYVKDTVAPFSGKIDIDGYVSVDEWGEPIIVTTPEHCQATWKSFWDFDKKSIVPYQAAKIYATNDDQYVYFAATLNETDFDMGEGKNYERAHFFITIGRYDEETGMERIRSKGKMYERFIRYNMGFEGTSPTVAVNGYKFDRVSISDDDWAIRYDAETRTYSYEIRIAYENTTLRYGNNNMMDVCFTMAQAQTNGKSANRYNIGGTGAANGSNKADNFAHTGQSLAIKLNANPYAQAGNWSAPAVANPDNGDISLYAVLALCGIAVVAMPILVVYRKKVK